MSLVKQEKRISLIAFIMLIAAGEKWQTIRRLKENFSFVRYALITHSRAESGGRKLEGKKSIQPWVDIPIIAKRKSEKNGKMLIELFIRWFRI